MTMKTLNDDCSGAPFRRPTNYRIRFIPKSRLRKEARQIAFEQGEKSPSIAVAYPRLKALTVNLVYFSREIVSWGHGVRYRLNLEMAKSTLHFHCPSSLCSGGGFDLSKDLGTAAAGRRNSLVRAVPCAGFCDLENGKTVPCQSKLHFKMILTYKTPGRARPAAERLGNAARCPLIDSNYETQ
jgi:hypothetical protein